MTPRPLLAALLGLTLVAACDGPDPVGYEFGKEEGDGEVGVWVHSGLYNREYLLHTPPDMSPTGSYPLVIFLHGAGDNGSSFHARLRADATTDSLGFIAAYPDGMEGTWTVGCGACTFAEALEADDVSFLATLARHLASELPVDTTRVYVAGYSQGGQLAQLYGCQSDLPPAGIATVAGQIYAQVSAACSPRGVFPVAIVHGDADPIAFYGGFGPGANILSAPETAITWLRRMSCDQEPVVDEIPEVASDFTHVTLYRFEECAPGAEVRLYRVRGGGHTWPGTTGPWGNITGRNSRNLETTREVLKFFLSVTGG